MTTETRNEAIIRRASKFSTIENARSWAYKLEKSWIVRKADQILVVRPVDASRLQKDGFTICR